ncbi:MAG TPA: deoxyribonuclease IV [Chloroflexota bacterium]
MRIGAHVSASGGLVRAVERARAIGAECLQIFVGAPQRWASASYTDAEVEAFRVASGGLHPIFIHASYLVNLASPDVANRERSVQSLQASLRWARRIGARGVITHLGSAKGAPLEEAETLVVEQLHRVLVGAGLATASDGPDGAAPSATGRAEPLLILETSAGMGHIIGARPAQLGRILRGLGAPPSVAVCVDTAHVFAAGYDVRHRAGIDALLQEVDAEIGLDRLVVVHANDSKVPLGKGVDRHENIGRGHIGESGFEALLTHPMLQDLPFVLEVPGYGGEGPDAPNILIMRRLAGLPIPPDLERAAAAAIAATADDATHPA